MNTTRRRVLQSAPWLIGLTAKASRLPAGEFVFESHTRGHQLRNPRSLEAPSRHERVPLLVVGGGIAGLSAAWWCTTHGFTDYLLLEMEHDAGGNSRSGVNGISAYPWGAHYIPIPNKESALVRQLFEECGLGSKSVWEERHLCHSPQERLYIHGRWQDGIEPEVAATALDHEEYRRFEEIIAGYRQSGVFQIPLTGPPTKLLDLDRLTFRQWLTQRGFRSPYLLWYCDYGVRDDYGGSLDEISAFAAIHYFAARSNDDAGPFTWPEGNGWIVNHLLRSAGNRVRTDSMVSSIVRDGQRWKVHANDVLYSTDAVIFAAPSFLAPYLLERFPPLQGFDYSPWLVANLTLDTIPPSASEPAWDNVIFGSPSLGYVVATHQSLNMHKPASVWTSYWALAGRDPKAVRRELLAANWQTWAERVLADLERPHRDIRPHVSRIDIFRNGHAMARPQPGFLTNPSRLRLQRGLEGLYFANSDVSGFSIFEEAQYRGVTAAQRALKHLGKA